MLFYENAGLESSSGYDSSYSTDLDRFQHGHTFAALARVVSRFFADRPVGSCFDIGCGQGQVLDHVFSLSRAADPAISPEGFVGIDLSRIAIAQSEQRNPAVMWVYDTYQGFLAHPEAAARYLGRTDLVINKGGLTFIEDEASYERVMADTAAYVRPGGGYFVMINRQFFQHWNLTTCRNWSRDIFEIAAGHYGEVHDFSTPAHLVLYFVKTGKAGGAAVLSPPTPVPLSLQIRFDDRIDGYRVGHDEHFARRLAYLDADRASTEPIDPRALLAADAANPDADGGAEPGRDGDLAGHLAARALSGRPNVLLPRDRIMLGAGRALRLKDLTSAPDIPVNLALLPWSLGNTRQACRHIDAILGLDAAAIVLGTGFRDSLVDRGESRPRIDLDEFSYRLDWLFRRMAAARMKVLFAMPMPQGESEDERFVYSARVAAPYLAEAARLAGLYGHDLLDLGRFAEDADRHVADLAAAAKGQKAPNERRLYREHVAGAFARAIEGLAARPPAPVPRLAPLPPAQDSFPKELLVTYSDRSVVRLIGADAESAYASLDFTEGRADEDEGSDGRGGGFGVLGGRNEFQIYRQRDIVSWLHANDRPDLPRAMIIGDSIRMRIADSTGYGIHAYRRLLGQVSLFHVPRNCGGTSSHRISLEGWLAPRPDIVHINAGLHDLVTNLRSDAVPPTYNPLPVYRENLRWMIETIRRAGAREVMFALNTPVEEAWHRVRPGTDKPRRIWRQNDTIRAYNQAIVEVMAELGVPVTDLFTPLWEAGVENVVLQDGVHLNHAGSALAGRIVAEAVEGALARLAAGAGNATTAGLRRA
ncbi:MAG: GDSL-type esterase/lipase family protein [Hyphomicrobiaceae bacterium]